MDRRAFVVAGVLAVFGVPFAAEAQPTPKIGFLSPFVDLDARIFTDPSLASPWQPVGTAFREGLAESGWIIGRNVTIEVKSTDREELLFKLAAELVDIKPDVLVTLGEHPVRALMGATRTIPIVVASVGDPVGTGLVESLTRPGGNVTAIIHVAPELSAKRVQLLKELVPSISRVAMLWNPTNPHNRLQLRGTQDGAHALGIDVKSVEIRSAGELDRAFITMHTNRIEGFIVAADNLLFNQQARIMSLAQAHRLYGIYPERSGPQYGGLMSYGPVVSAIYQQTGAYAGKILRGAKAGELPVLQPTQFELVINLKTAKSLGLTIPQSLLLRADQVIE